MAANSGIFVIVVFPIFECLILWEGKGQFYYGDRWVEAETFDCVLAPCGVRHQVKGRENPLAGRWFGGGFASPPQLDLYMETEYHKDGKFSRPRSLS